MDWKNKVVLITGASSGLGAELARQLAQRGAVLGLLARRAEQLEELAARCVSAGGRAVVLPADVTDAAAAQAAADKLRAECGHIDTLVANAGTGDLTDGKKLPADKVAHIFRVNLIGASNAVAAVAPQMVARGSGHLVAISSLSAYRGLPKSGAYCASKAGLSALFESIRLDLKGTGVDVSIIHPGFIKTPLTSGREAKMPFLMELEDGTARIRRAIERRQKSYAFPWQLATIVRLGMIMPIPLYDFIAARNNFRE
jgi:short-subunit dehydrogenase